MKQPNFKAKKYYRPDGSAKQLTKANRKILCDWLFFDPDIEDCDSSLLKMAIGLGEATGGISQASDERWKNHFFYNDIDELYERFFRLRDVLYKYFFDKYLRNTEKSDPSSIKLFQTSKSLTIDNSQEKVARFYLDGTEEIAIRLAVGMDESRSVFYPVGFLRKDTNPLFFDAYNSKSEVTITIIGDHLKSDDNPEGESNGIVLSGTLEFFRGYKEEIGCGFFWLNQHRPWNASAFKEFPFVKTI